jgi:hypothetical protein
VGVLSRLPVPVPPVSEGIAALVQRGSTMRIALVSRSSRGPNVTPNRADLACERDQDCQVESSDIRGCCAYKTTKVQPFAIAKRALEAFHAECASVLCTLPDISSPGLADPKHFVAVCVRRTCRLRPAPPPPPECVDDGVPSLCDLGQP